MTWHYMIGHNTVHHIQPLVLSFHSW